MIDEAELRRMTPDEGSSLPAPWPSWTCPDRWPASGSAAAWQIGLLVLLCCCLFLAAWIAVLVLTLPGHYTSRDWRTVWVGLDIAELAGFAATGWAAWNQRQVVVFLMITTRTLLVCDAWFDLTLDYGSRGFTASLISALVAELPLAFIMFSSARRLTRANVQVVMHLAGISGPAPALWRVPLFAAGLESALPPRLRPSSADVTASPGSS